jgi:hypothetical protein
MADVEDLRIVLRTEVEKAVADLGKASKRSRETTKSFSDLSKQFKSQVSGALSMKNAFAQMAGSVAAGIGIFTLASKSLQAIGQTVRESVQAFQVQEQAVAKLEGVLRATGGAAGLTSKEMQAFASELQSSTQYGDEAILDLQGTLATFKSVSGDTFNEATRLAVDLSAAFGGDLQSSAMMVGKALEDPVRGITAMRRAGVSFTEAQQDLIKALVDTGKKSEAQALILEELESQVGGVAKAMADTSSGALVQYQNVMSDVKEEVGRFILDGLKPLIQGFTDVASSVQQSIKAQNEYNAALRAVQSGNATQDQRLMVLNAQAETLNNQIAGMERIAKDSRTQGFYDKARHESLKDSLNSTVEQIRWLQLSVSLSGQAAQAAKERAAEEARVDAARQEERVKLEAYLDRVNSAYEQTSQGKIDLLKKEIAEFEAYAASAVKTAPQVQAVLSKLREELDKLVNPETKGDDQKDPTQQRLESLYAATKEGVAAAKAETVAFVEAQRGAALATGASAEQLAMLDTIARSLAETMGEETSGGLQLFDENLRKMSDALENFAQSVMDSMSQLSQDAFLDFFEAMGTGANAADAFGQSFAKMAQQATRQIAVFALAAGVRILAETGLAGLPVALALFALAGVSAAVSGGIGGAMSGPRTVDYDRYIVDPVVEAEKELARQRLEVLKDQLEAEKKLRDANLRQLEDHFSQEFDVLRDLWDRGLVSTAEFAEKATTLRAEQGTAVAAAEAPYDAAAAALKAEEDAQAAAEKALEQARQTKLSALATQAKEIQDKLNKMSKWDKFWSGKDERYEKDLSALDRRLAVVQNANTIAEIQAAATGAYFMTNGPQLLMVGDNPGGKERVSVSPISSPNINGPQSGGLTIVLNGPVYGIDDLYQQLEMAGRRMTSRRRVAQGAIA